MTAMVVIVCDSSDSALAAKEFLKRSGFAEANITTDSVATFSYDGQTFVAGGTVSEIQTGRVVVIGRK